MQKSAIVVLLTALLLTGAFATPRLLHSDASAEAEEHQRILAELEMVSQLRERMLQEGVHLVCGPALGHAVPGHASRVLNDQQSSLL